MLLKALKSERDAVEGGLHTFVAYTCTGMGTNSDEVASELLHHIIGSVCPSKAVDPKAVDECRDGEQ
jgi:hypothetical protein